MKDVAATIHELECNPSVYRMATAAERLQHAQCMLRIVWLFQNYSCAFNDGVYTHYDVDTSTARCKNLITRAIKTGEMRANLGLHFVDRTRLRRCSGLHISANS